MTQIRSMVDICSLVFMSLIALFVELFMNGVEASVEVFLVVAGIIWGLVIVAARTSPVWGLALLLYWLWF